MLPSGNDAANELANWGGLLLLADKEKGYRLCRAAFIDEMNKQARNLNLKNTLFGNPHGLPHQGAKSTAADLAKLCCKCMKNLLFRKIVSCKSYKLAVKSGKGTRLI
jgi:D-alanyl-D-alanine carboxypeptidase